MTVRIGCPSCHASLSMPEKMYGRQVKCPKCQQPFQCPSGPAQVVAAPPAQPVNNAFAFDAPPQAPVAAPAAAPLDFGEPAPAAPARGGAAGWGRVQSSLMFHFIAAGCFLTAFCLSYIPSVTRDPLKGKPDDGKTLMIISLVVLLGGAIVALIGEGSCCAAPRESGARGAAQMASLLMLGAVICGALFTVMFIGSITAKAPPSEGVAMIMPLMLLAYIGGILGSFLVFQFFLALSGTSLRSRALVSNTISFAAFFYLSPIILIGLSYVKEMLMGPSMQFGREEEGKFMRWLPLILLVVNLGWFSLVLLSLKNAIARAARSASY